jgi:hypothetical protein
MNKRILLKENEVIYNEVIYNEQQQFENGKTLLRLLAKIGIVKTELTNWSEIESLVTVDYPKAPIQFNIDANGITEQYREAEAFFLKHYQRLSFEPITAEQIEAMKEKHRIYATTEKQLEAYALINTVIDSLNRLIELGIDINVNKTYIVNRAFEGDPRLKPPLKVNQSHLTETLMHLK